MEVQLIQWVELNVFMLQLYYLSLIVFGLIFYLTPCEMHGVLLQFYFVKLENYSIKIYIKINILKCINISLRLD